jgi:hypothetical protein
MAAYHCYQISTKFYPTFFSQCELYVQKKLVGTVIIDFDLIIQLLLKSAFVKY